MDYTEIVNAIVKLQLPLSKIILFGSAARNESTIQSDIDLALVMRESVTNEHRRPIARALSEFETLDNMLDINCFYTTEDELATATHWSNPCVDIRKEGVVLWQR